METRCNKRSYSNSETIPMDLIIEILTRLPAKSLARFRCVSKLWESTLGSSSFAKSFSTISSSRPKLLFTCLLDHEAFFFSSPQPQNSYTLTADFHMSSYDYPFEFSRPVHGLIFGLNQWTSLKGKKTVTVPMICNPSTRQSLTLPRVKTRKKKVRSVLGYDSIEKQFKVLCMTLSYRGVGSNYSSEHQVLTLGTGKKLSWRMIKCDLPHDPVPMERSNDHYVFDGVCINGVLYYLASVQGGDGYPDIVCFDIRSENFKCIRKAQGIQGMKTSILVNYKGKLAMLHSSSGIRIETSFQLRILEDAEKHQWSNYIYILPPSWKQIAATTMLRFVGMTSMGEIVLSPKFVSDSFYLVYYNPERKTFTRVEIQGMEAFKTLKAYISLDHVEDVKLMASG